MDLTLNLICVYMILNVGMNMTTNVAVIDVHRCSYMTGQSMPPQSEKNKQKAGTRFIPRMGFGNEAACLRALAQHKARYTSYHITYPDGEIYPPIEVVV